MDEKTKKIIKENAVDEGFLQDWYQNSVLEADTPVWTDEHIAEVTGDFYLIPKEVIDGREIGSPKFHTIIQTNQTLRNMYD